MRNTGHAKALWIAAGLAVLLAGAVSYFASSRPDALKYGVDRYAPGGQRPVVGGSGGTVPLPQDAAPASQQRRFMRNALAGLAGVAATFVAIVVVGFLITRGRSGREAKPNG